MGCGSSVAVLPEEGGSAIMYNSELKARKSGKGVRSSDSLDSGVGYELGSKESTSCEDEMLPDIAHLRGPSFADRKPLPPHPFEATFKERFPAIGTPNVPVIGAPNEVCHDVERALQPADLASEFLLSGQPLRPLRRAPQKAASQKHGEIVAAVNQARRPIVSDQPIRARHPSEKGDHMLYDLHKSVDYDTQVAARPPSRGGLAFDLVFGEQHDLNERREKLKKRQKNKAPKLPKKISKGQVQRKLIEAELRRQQQTLETLTKLSESHSTVEQVGSRSNKMEEIKRSEMKKAQDAAMEKAIAARRQHLEEMRDKIRVKNEKIRKANVAGRPPTSGSVRPPTAETKLPSLLGF